MVDYKDEKTLRELKAIYDETIKEDYLAMAGAFGEDDFPYSARYPLYFKKKILNNLTKEMRKDTLLAYKNAPGHELDEGENGRPPKFLSVASSSNFCYTSLDVNESIDEEEGADFFSREGETIERVYFEKPLPIIKSPRATPPTIDAYANSGETEYFFECKCHEMFDIHSLTLSEKYFDSGDGLIVDSIPKEYLHPESDGIRIDPQAFGVEELVFDVKQLLTHLMGIQRNAKAKRCDLVYFYFAPRRKFVQDERVLEVVDKALEDAKKVFSSPIIKSHCEKHNIRLVLAVKTSNQPYAAASDNTDILFAQ